MPVTIRRYTELRLAISDYLQERNWFRLLEVCGTSDEEAQKTIAVIFTLYDEKNVWRFLDYVAELSPDERRQKRDSVATACFTIGKMGQSDVKKSVSTLKLFLSDDPVLKGPVIAALSNMWVLDTKTTSSILYDSWVLGSKENEDLEEAAVRSSQYLSIHEPKLAAPFLEKVVALDGERKVSSSVARELLAHPGGPERGAAMFSSGGAITSTSVGYMEHTTTTTKTALPSSSSSQQENEDEENRHSFSSSEGKKSKKNKNKKGKSEKRKNKKKEGKKKRK